MKKVPLAWRMAVHSKGRTILASAGIGMAIMLIFFQLGLLGMLGDSSTLIQESIDFHLVLVSRNYLDLVAAGTIPRLRLSQATSDPSVSSVKPLHVGSVSWRNPERRSRTTILAIGSNPEDEVFSNPSVHAHLESLKQPDTFIMERVSGGPKRQYGTPGPGEIVELNGHRTRLVGLYSMGLSMVELGTILLSDRNFVRLVPGSSLDRVTMGLVKLKDPATATATMLRLRHGLPEDVEVMTRQEYLERERHYFVWELPTGIIFGSGVGVSFLVGIVILYQTLATLVAKHLREFATLKAMGYTNGDLTGIVLRQSALLCIAGFIPGIAIALCLYPAVENETGLPVRMTGSRVIGVACSVAVMSVIGGLLSLKRAYQTDPAELF